MKLGYVIPHEIKIRASANMGFIVKIECGEFVAVNEHVLLDDLTEYLKDPKKWEEEYNKLPGRGGPITEAGTSPEHTSPEAEEDVVVRE